MSWVLLAAMVGLVVLVRQLPQVRGFLDAGVVVGVAWGAAAVLVIAWRALRGRPPAVPLELPAGTRQAP